MLVGPKLKFQGQFVFSEWSVLELTAGPIQEDTHVLLSDLMKGNLPIAGSRIKQTLIVGWR